jgi:predicted DNA-binding protein with PD1-like motif
VAELDCGPGVDHEEVGMRAKLLDADGAKTYAVIFETGDEVMAGLRAFAKERGLDASHLTAIGAFSDVVLGFFDWERKAYATIPLAEQVEVLSLVGDIALKDGEPEVHAHVVVGKADGSAHGGHLMTAHVRPTLEVILVESPAYLRRQLDPETGLALIRP